MGWKVTCCEGGDAEHGSTGLSAPLADCPVSLVCSPCLWVKGLKFPARRKVALRES